HPLAAQAAARVLEAGGNAIDAGVAAGFMLGVVHPDMVSFAGVAPILVHRAGSGEALEVSGVGPCPRKATAGCLRAYCGEPRAPGDLFVQAELAETIKLMVEAETRARRRGRARAIRAARDVFYKGEIARRIVEFNAQEGGLLTAEDLADFHAEVAPALRVGFRDYEVAACGFWCQGPVLLQMLNLIEPFDFAALGHNSPRALHLLV